MDENEKLRVVHDLPFSGGEATVRKKRETREQEATLENGGRPVNAENDWERIPECRLAGAMNVSHADTGITGEV